MSYKIYLNYKYELNHHENPMKTFKLDPDGFKEISKKTYQRTIPLMLFSIVTVIFMLSQTQESQTSIMDVLPFLLPIMLITIGIGLRKGIKRQQALWDSYELTIDIDEEIITRKQENVPNVSIWFDEIVGIEETPNGDYLIKSINKFDFINIPKAVINREELVPIIQDMGEITKQSASKINLPIFTSIGTIILFAIFFISQNKIIAVGTGIILIVSMIWSYIQIQKSKSIDKKSKKGMLLLAFVLFSIISKLFMVFNS